MENGGLTVGVDRVQLDVDVTYNYEHRLCLYIRIVYVIGGSADENILFLLVEYIT